MSSLRNRLNATAITLTRTHNYGLLLSFGRVLLVKRLLLSSSGFLLDDPDKVSDEASHLTELSLFLCFPSSVEAGQKSTGRLARFHPPQRNHFFAHETDPSLTRFESLLEANCAVLSFLTLSRSLSRSLSLHRNGTGLGRVARPLRRPP